MRTNWNTPLDLPPARAGLYEIQHETAPAGALALASEPGAPSVIFDAPTRWHRLVGPDVAASDRPAEQARLDLAVRPVTWGRTVLVVGLDLGYLATVLARRKKVKRVIVIESRRNVIDLVWPYLLLDDSEARAKVEVVHADLAPWIAERRARGWQFDWTIADLASGASVNALFDQALPLRAALAGVCPTQRTLVLGEDRMREACAAHLATRLVARAKQRSEAPATAETWDTPFWRWVDAHGDFQRAALMIQAYARTVGLPQHEALWQSAVADDAARYAS